MSLQSTTAPLSRCRTAAVAVAGCHPIRGGNPTPGAPVSLDKSMAFSSVPRLRFESHYVCQSPRGDTRRNDAAIIAPLALSCGRRTSPESRSAALWRARAAAAQRHPHHPRHDPGRSSRLLRLTRGCNAGDRSARRPRSPFRAGRFGRSADAALARDIAYRAAPATPRIAVGR
jgi:hypothetical protein